MPLLLVFVLVLLSLFSGSKTGTGGGGPCRSHLDGVSQLLLIVVALVRDEWRLRILAIDIADIAIVPLVLAGIEVNE